MVRERDYNGLPGIPTMLALVAGALTLIWVLVADIQSRNAVGITLSAIALAFVVFLLLGLFMVSPNQGVVLQLFGAYRGTAKAQGLRWANPLLSKKAVSLRVRNFESSRLKVNDNDGNPIEIAAVVVWKVVETAEAVFEVDDFENYVHVQSEAALRNLATSYPYDAHAEELVSLRSHTSAVADHLKREIQERLSKAGVEVIEARISHLAYAPEIAAAMLQRQQAGAIIAARQKIVEGAVGHGGNGARHAGAQVDRRARRGAQGVDGQQPAGRPLRRARRAADHQHGDDLSMTSSAECGVRSAKSVRSAECEVRAQCGVRSAKCGVRSPCALGLGRTSHFALHFAHRTRTNFALRTSRLRTVDAL